MAPRVSAMSAEASVEALSTTRTSPGRPERRIPSRDCSTTFPTACSSLRQGMITEICGDGDATGVEASSLSLPSSGAFGPVCSGFRVTLTPRTSAIRRRFLTAGRLAARLRGSEVLGERGRARLRRAHRLGHDEVRSALRLVVDPPEVLADEAEEQELHAGEERDRHDEGGEALRRGTEEEALEDRVQRVDRSRCGDAGPEQPGGAERCHREGEHSVEREPEELPHGVARRPARARLALDRYPGLLEADPRAQTADVAMALGKQVDLVDDPSREEGEVARVDGNGDLGETSHERIEEVVGGPLRARLLAPDALRVDHVIAAVVFGDEAGDLLGTVLQVGVPNDERLA